MAKITFGPIVSEARNKVGGVVYSRNTYGPYSRAFIVPPYTNTSAQAAARAALTALSQRWGSTLTDEQRAGWRSLGELYPHTDVFKQVNSRPGLQAYLRANLALASVGSSPVDTAPQNWHATDPGEITATAVSGAPPTISVNAENPPAIAEAVQIWVTPQQSPGANYFYRRLRLVATAPAGTAGPWNPSAGWAARFAALAFPAKLGLGVRYVNVETGATGPMRTALITATEGETDMLRSVTRVLTYAEILALDTTPIELVPAPGASKFFDLIDVTGVVQGPTDWDTGPSIVVSVGPTGLGLSLPVAQWLGFAPTAVVLNGGAVGGIWGLINYGWNDAPQRVNLPLQLRCLSGPFTGGDPANTIRITVFYTESDF